ncbi:MAG: trypsin-like peptidase domain-containing protein [Ruminococcus sp.]|jgi:serine protease Do|nr:trypsin-like peptidase domain-containing protein [Ruminococcus sp.]
MMNDRFNNDDTEDRFETANRETPEDTFTDETAKTDTAEIESNFLQEDPDDEIIEPFEEEEIESEFLQEEPDYKEENVTPKAAVPVYAPPPTNASAKQMSNRAIGILTAAILLLAIAAAVLPAFSESRNSENSPLGGNDSVLQLPDNAGKGDIQINVEQAARPMLPDENYADRETGKFTDVGVAQYLMPSIALVKVYGDNVYSQIGSGSGVIMTANGYIITNAHVIEGGKLFSVQLSSGKVYEAVAVGSDSKQDVAVLKIEAEGLTPATFGNSADVKLGEEVAVVASSGQTLADAVTFGNVSNISRQVTIESGDTVDCVQIDAAVNPGNSGGPVVNMFGQVIGIVDSKKVGITSEYNTNIYEGIGFALQIDNVIETAESIIEYGYSQTSVRIGILYVAVSDLTASYYDVESGLLVQSIDPDCDIAKSGLLPGDIITSIDGQKVLSPESILKVLEGKKPGDRATFEFVRRDLTEKVTKYSGTFTYEPVIPFPSNDSYGVTADTTPAE